MGRARPQRRGVDGVGPGPLADAFPAALKRAAAAIDTGAARDVLDRWVALSTRLATTR